MPLRPAALNIILKFADNLSSRFILLHKLSILKPLLHAVYEWKDEKRSLEALKAFYKCTFEIHYMALECEDEILIRGARQAIAILKTPRDTEKIEISLGILANLSRMTSVIHKALRSRDDFEVLRKILLHIMNEELSTQVELVLSMTVIFHLWGIQDKFFDRRNFHSSVQILFNILLNGKFSVESLYAGHILIEFCMNPTSFALVKSHPALHQTLDEVVNQLNSNNSKLVHTFVEFLKCLVKNDLELCAYTRSRCFNFNSDNEAIGVIPGICRHLMQLSDHFLAASTATLIFELEYWYSKSPSVKLTSPIAYNATLVQLLSVITQSLSGIGVEKCTLETVYRNRVILRCASLLVQKTAEACCSLDSESVGTSASHVARLASTIHSLARHNLESNIQLSSFLSKVRKEKENIGDTAQANVVMSSMLLTVDSLDLLLVCTDFFSTASPISQKSPDNTGPLDPDETRIDCTPQMAEMHLHEEGSVVGHLHKCSDALQHCLETPTVAPMLALVLVLGDEVPSGIFCCRAAVLRLLKIALNLEKFSISTFLSTFSEILPPGSQSIDQYIASRLLNSGRKSSCSPSFSSEWIAATQPHSLSNTSQCPCKSIPFSVRHSSEAILDKLCNALNNSSLSVSLCGWFERSLSPSYGRLLIDSRSAFKFRVLLTCVCAPMHSLFFDCRQLFRDRRPWLFVNKKLSFSSQTRPCWKPMWQPKQRRCALRTRSRNTFEPAPSWPNRRSRVSCACR
uniref:Protein CIP2A n=1 Tax=Mesocestoides corti TaxID=53468 RepID=A0A5K3FFW1_MESCO